MKNSTQSGKTSNYFFLSSLFLAVLGAGLFFISCKQSPKMPPVENAGAQNDTIAAAPVAANKSDDAFLVETANVNLEEIALGKLAQERASSKHVKDFGKMMVDGHTKCLNELKALAAKKGVTLPTEVNAEGKKTADELTTTDPKGFDRTYIGKMVDGHKQAITKFEAARDNTGDAEIKAWIVKTLPDLRMHLDHAVMVQQEIN